MTRTVPHNPDDAAEVAAVQTPDGQPNAELIDPSRGPTAFALDDDESSEEVAPE